MINAHFAAATKRPIPPKIKARTINTITAALIKYSFIGCYVRIPGAGQEQTEMGLLLRSRRRTVTDRAHSSRDFRIVARRTRVTGVPPGLVDDVASDTIIVPVQEAFLVDSRAASTPPNRWIEVQSARVIGTGTPTRHDGRAAAREPAIGSAPLNVYVQTGGPSISQPWALGVAERAAKESDARCAAVTDWRARSSSGDREVDLGRRNGATLAAGCF